MGKVELSLPGTEWDSRGCRGLEPRRGGGSRHPRLSVLLAGFEHGVGLSASTGCAGAPLLAGLQLLLAGLGEDGTEVFVLHHLTLGDLAQLVEDAVGQGDSVVEDC